MSNRKYANHVWLPPSRSIPYVTHCFSLGRRGTGVTLWSSWHRRHSLDVGDELVDWLLIFWWPPQICSLSLSLQVQVNQHKIQLLGSHCFPSTPLGSPQGDDPPPLLRWRLCGR
ncbi:hypothetical protein Hanom_Chr05g00460011 [Helianthus anomalus]